MGPYIIRRLLYMIVVLLFVTAITFFIFFVLPTADPAALRAGRSPTPETLKAIREQLGLDKSLPEQFFLYIKGLVLHFDFGNSFVNNQDVRGLILDRLPNTLFLISGAAILWFTGGVLIGTISAVYRGTLLDRAAMTTALVAISAPVYWFGLVALYVFASDIGRFPIFPGSGSYQNAHGFFAKIPTLILPWIVLAAAFAAIYARLTRSNLLEVMSEDYVRTARAKGLTERRVIIRHGLRAAITPVITILGLDLGILVGGAILTESVFGIPGIGRLSFDAIQRGDLATIQGTTLFLAFAVVLMNLIVDILYAFLDPESAVLMALLEVKDLKVHFDTEDGTVHALDGISYSVDSGQVLGIVGESGSGKSVSSLTIMGLTRSANARISGEVLFDGKDLLKASDSEMRQLRGDDIAMIFQDPLSSLHPFYRIGAQLVEAVRAHRSMSKAKALDRAVEMLSLVGIPEPRRRVDSYPHEFSGGMRQRVMIAMALINDPKLLIADEPTTALDVTVQAQILELIERLRRELDTAIVMITHDLGVVAEVTDDIAVMYAGRIVEHADTETIFVAPEHPYTWGLLKSIPRLDLPRDEPLVPIQGRPPSLILLPTGCSFHPRCPYVREAHKKIDPHLVETAESADGGRHRVACLLPPQTRRALWRELGQGATPAEAKERVELPAEAVDTEAAR